MKRLWKTDDQDIRKKYRIGSIAFILILLCAVGVTWAYLSAETGAKKNAFEPGRVTCEVVESFDGTVKRDVNVRNTGNIDAYLRVALKGWRVSDGKHVGGQAQPPAFVPGPGWVKHGAFYYYTKPVAPQALPEHPLVKEMTLTSYKGMDPGAQSITVTAEAIQANPARAAELSWGVTITAGNVTTYSGR